MWKLVIEDDEGKRTVVPLSREDYTIGRKEGHAIRLTERNISRNHAQIKRKNGSASGYQVADLSSYNGVFVNGLRVAEPQDVQHGDLIQVGDYRIILNDDSAAETTQEVDVEDIKSTVVPGRKRAGMTGQMLLQRPNRLVMLIGPTPGDEYPLDKDRTTIGRAEDATISVNHNSVSRLHCEIHMLSEGRFEIVDKGSSNGVRVNSSDLPRGIIEAGDLIELGDVRFKFVGVGQVFVPNATDSQRMAAITDREAGEILAGSSRSTSILPFILIGLVLGAAAVGAAYFVNRIKDPATPDRGLPTAEPTQTAQPVLNADMEVLTIAYREQNTDLEQAYRRIHAFSLDSPARREDKFTKIVALWAESRIKRANADRQNPQNIGGLTEVANSPDVPDALRTQASELLNELQPPPPVPHTGPRPTQATTREPAPTHRPNAPVTATATANTKPGPDIGGYVAGLVTSKEFPKARGACLNIKHPLSPLELSQCKQACKGESEAGYPMDPGCMNTVNNLPRKQ
jgi:ABC transport system ATP-binding/permease protein